MQIKVNGERREWAEGRTVAALLAELELSGKPVAVEVNRRVAPREEHARWELVEGDEVEVVSLVGGG